MSEEKITVESGYIPRVYPIPYKGDLVDMSYCKGCHYATPGLCVDGLDLCLESIRNDF